MAVFRQDVLHWNFRGGSKNAGIIMESQYGANKWLITASVMIPTLLEILDTSIANVALGHIQGSLSAGQDEVTWVLTSYLVSNAVVIPMSGWLSRVFGRKRYLLASVAIFTFASMLCGLAGSLKTLIIFRIIQGVGGGGLQPISQAILIETFPPSQRGLSMGIYGMGAVLGPFLGPLLGGYITDNYTWQWIFFINIPLGMVAIAMISNFVHDPHYLARFVKSEKIDYLGLILLTVGLGCLQIVLDKGQREDWMESQFILTMSIISGVSLLSLIVLELAHENPIVNLRIFKDRSFATGNVVMFFGYFAFFGSIVLLPEFLQTLMGYTSFLAGVVLGPGGLIMLATLPLVGKMTGKIDARFLLFLGLGITAFSLVNMSRFTLDIDLGTAIMARNYQALGIAFFFVPLSYLVMAYVPRESMNNASAIFSLLRNLGGSFGVAFVTTLLARRTQFHQARMVEHLSPLNQNFSAALHKIHAYLATSPSLGGGAEKMALAAISQKMQQQAMAMAFFDVFYVLAIIFACLMVVMWIIRKPVHAGEGEKPELKERHLSGHLSDVTR